MSGGEVGVLWAGASVGVGVGVTCSAGPCPRALGLPPLWEVGNQPQPGLGPHLGKPCSAFHLSNSKDASSRKPFKISLGPLLLPARSWQHVS